MRHIATMAPLALAALLAACGDARLRPPQASGGACASCHGDSTRQPTALNPLLPAAPPQGVGGQTSPSDRAVGAHQTHLVGAGLSAGVACDECHVVPSSSAHIDGTPQVTYGNVATSGGTLVPIWNGSTCSSTYCHGNFPNGNSGYAPTWTAPNASPCGTCHGTPANPAPGGTHPPVAANSCGTCHLGYTGTSVEVSTHVNGSVDVPNLSCTSCHGTGGRVSVANADANQAAAPPVDTQGSNATTSRGVGSHLVHVNGTQSRPVACAACHDGAVPTQPAHSNGTVTVAFGGLATTGGVTPSYAGGGSTCSASYCHGNFPGGAGAGATPAWTTAGTLACTACHGAPPPLSASVHHPQNLGCSTCHPLGAGTHVDGTIQRPTGCTACHGDLATGRTLANATIAAPGVVAASVDTTGGTAATAPGVGAHAAHLTNTTWRAAPIACSECHQLPPSDADVSHATGAGTGGARATLSWGQLATGAVNAWSGAPVTPGYAGSASGTYGSTAGSCSATYCHGNFRNGLAAAVNWTTGSAACGSCHGTPPGGTHPGNTDCGSCHGTGYSITTVDKALHMNGVLDGGGEPTAGGSSCGGCHGAIFSAMTTGAPPAGSTRHFLGGGDNPIDPGGSWTGAATLKASPLYATASCVSMCHGDHPHDVGGGTTHEWNVYLDANARSATPSNTTRDDTDFDATQANGGLCISCHQIPVDANHPAVAAAGFDTSAHDYVQNTVGANTYTWSYTLHDGGAFRRNCTKCHADRADGRPGDSTTPFGAVHSAANQSLLAGTTNPAGTPATFVCYNCHGNGTTGTDLSGKDIASQIAHATTAGQSGHPANSDSVHDSVTELNNAAFGNTLGVTGRHASCLDCHDPHEARAGTHAVTTNLAGPPLQGAWGAQLSSNPAFWTAPVAGNFTKKTILAGTDLEATLCFKCHSSYYGALPTSPSGGFTETDVAREFNPNNVGNYATTGTTSWQSGETAGGFHPVLAAAGSNLGAVNMANLVTANFAWRTSGARNLMTCTDCHESDNTADPNGPHGSTAGFVLRGPNTTWNNTIAATSAGMPAGVFCANCHSSTWASSRFPSGDSHTSRSQHRVACMNCHAAIPHGGPRPGMLVAPAGAAVGVGGTIAGWDNAQPYANPGTGNRLYIASYPTTNATTWNQNNCGCNGTGH